MDTTLYGGDARWTTVRQGTAEQCRTLWLERKDAGGQVEWRGGKGDSDAEEGVGEAGGKEEEGRVESGVGGRSRSG